MSRYIKTIVALVGSLATWGITAAEDNVYSQVELWGAVLALATAAGVYALPNRPPSGEQSRADMSEQDAGRVDVVTALVVVLILVVILVLLGVV